MCTDEDLRRFMRQVDKLPNGCWFWTGARSRGKGNNQERKMTLLRSGVRAP